MDPTQALWKAVWNGQVAEMEAALRAGADPNQPHRRAGHVVAQTPLMYLCWDSRLMHCHAGSSVTTMVRLLLEHGAHLDGGMQPHQSKPLAHAADVGHMGVVRVLMSHGADPQDANEGEQCAILGACSGNHLNVLKYFVRHGADINRRHGKEGLTCLDVAIRGGSLRVMSWLLAQGAQLGAVQLPEETGSTHAQRCLIRVLRAYDMTDRRRMLALLLKQPDSPIRPAHPQWGSSVHDALATVSSRQEKSRVVETQDLITRLLPHVDPAAHHLAHGSALHYALVQSEQTNESMEPTLKRLIAVCPLDDVSPKGTVDALVEDADGHRWKRPSLAPLVAFERVRRLAERVSQATEEAAPASHKPARRRM